MKPDLHRRVFKIIPALEEERNIVGFFSVTETSPQLFQLQISVWWPVWCFKEPLAKVFGPQKGWEPVPSLCRWDMGSSLAPACGGFDFSKVSKYFPVGIKCTFYVSVEASSCSCFPSFF